MKLPKTLRRIQSYKCAELRLWNSFVYLFGLQSPQKRSNAKLRFSLINAAQVDTPTKKAPQLRRKSSIIASITSPFESLFNTFQAPAQPDQLGTNIDTDLMTWSDDEDSEQSDGRDVVQFDEYQHQSDSSDSDSDEEAVNTVSLTLQ